MFDFDDEFEFLEQYEDELNDIVVTYTANFDFLKCSYEDKGKKMLLLEGGTRSGKTYAIIQFLLYLVISSSKPLKITVARDSFTSIVDALLPDFEKIINEMGLSDEFHHNQQKHYFRHDNGSMIKYVGVMDDYRKTGGNKVHGLRQDIVWINEGLTVVDKIYKQLFARTTDLKIIDYNPSAETSHVYNYVNLPKSAFFKTTQLDNPFLSEDQRALILSTEPTTENIKNGTVDEWYWNVYGLGKRMAGDDAIFKELYRFSGTPEHWGFYGYGGDWGFQNDPTCLVRGWIDGRDLYLQEVFSDTQLQNRQVATLIKQFCPDWRNSYFVFDSAEMKSIIELRSSPHNIPMIPAKKGNGSRAETTNVLKNMRIFIHEDSDDIYSEFKDLRWAKNNDGSFKLDKANRRIPQDGNDHYFDATRYFVNKHL